MLGKGVILVTHLSALRREVAPAQPPSSSTSALTRTPGRSNRPQIPHSPKNVKILLRSPDNLLIGIL
jgi:hypothetical protein